MSSRFGSRSKILRNSSQFKFGDGNQKAGYDSNQLDEI